MNTSYKSFLVDLFVKDSNITKYIFGINPVTSQIIKYVKVDAIIDEYTSKDEYYGIPIIHKLEEIDRNTIIVNAIFFRFATSVQIRLEKAGFNVIDIFSLIKYSGFDIDIIHYNGISEIYTKERKAFDELLDRLSDIESKIILTKLLDFRLNYNLSAMNGIPFDEENQYFEPFLSLNPTGESFVDVGGFDGYTTLQFIKRCPLFNKVYFFEPGVDYLNKARKLLSCYNNIEYIEAAVSEKRGSVYFSLNDSSSMMSESGGVSVNTEKIDDIISEPVTFIKMDIEGSESLAITGAINTIKQYHPRLAISVYHKPDDYIEIPKLVLSIRDDYDIYMRHYTEGVDETVMFFVPRN